MGAPGARWLVKPGKEVSLADRPTKSADGAPGDKEQTKAALDELRAELVDLQARLYAESEQSLLIVLQAMDAGGKDGTIRAVFSGVNPQGVRVHSFKAPTELELKHDFLWRVHAETPAQGEITIFNRSHYEDVLIVRVHDLVPEDVWRARYEHIRAFETLLHDANTRVVKLFLHISKDEQRARLQERVDLPEKRWKFNAADLAERKRWGDYQQAFADAIAETSTTHAPWYIVPGDRNWYRNWAVLTILVETLREMDPKYPPAPEGVEGTVVE